MFPMTITISDKTQLDAVLSALNPEEVIAKESPAKNTKPASKAKVEAKAETKVEEKADAKHEAKAETKVEEKADAPRTYQEAADAVTGLARDKGRDAAVAVLKQFGVSKLPDLGTEHFAGIIAACEAAQEA